MAEVLAQLHALQAQKEEALDELGEMHFSRDHILAPAMTQE